MSAMAIRFICLLPILVFLWFPITFLVTFVIAVLLGHVNPVFPYISDSGTFSPESCVFAQMINVGVLLFGFLMYVRYRQTREIWNRHSLPPRLQKLNFAALFIGFVSVTGISIVGNFQETNVTVAHVLGAGIGFGLGITYLALQTVISFKLFPLVGVRCILYARLVLCCICIFMFMMCSIFGAISICLFRGKRIEDVTKWTKKDGGWEYHLVSTVTEWICAFGIMFYILTFTPDFQRVTISEPVVSLDEELFAQPRLP